MVAVLQLLREADEREEAPGPVEGQAWLEEGADQMMHPVIAVFDQMQEIVESKAHDYAKDTNVFSNFEFAADVAGVTVEQEFMVMIGTKVARLRELMGGKKPNNESLEDSLLDLANYAALMVAYMRKDG
jgi:hypothetical protein